MCCGRGVRSAASKTYAAPLSASKESKMPDKKVSAPEPVPNNYPTPQKVGAYYGNPIARKKVKKLDPSRSTIEPGIIIGGYESNVIGDRLSNALLEDDIEESLELLEDGDEAV